MYTDWKIDLQRPRKREKQVPLPLIEKGGMAGSLGVFLSWDFEQVTSP